MEIDWPDVEWGLQLGAGGDEGYHFVLPPHSIKDAIDVVDKTYENASKAEKEKIERAASELYGGLEQLRKTRCVIIRMYHWAAEVEIFPTFKHLLEDFVVGMDKAIDSGSEEDHGSGESDGSNE